MEFFSLEELRLKLPSDLKKILKIRGNCSVRLREMIDSIISISEMREDDRLVMMFQYEYTRITVIHCKKKIDFNPFNRHIVDADTDCYTIITLEERLTTDTLSIKLVSEDENIRLFRVTDHHYRGIINFRTPSQCTVDMVLLDDRIYKILHREDDEMMVTLDDRLVTDSTSLIVLTIAGLI